MIEQKLWSKAIDILTETRAFDCESEGVEIDNRIIQLVHNFLSHIEKTEKHIECQTAENYLLADCLCLEYHECVGAISRNNALLEAVAWERECKRVRNDTRMFRNWPEAGESQRSYHAARAEVDRLLQEEKP